MRDKFEEPVCLTADQPYLIEKFRNSVNRSYLLFSGVKAC